ncbi:MAG: hypothetical protein KBC84_07050 [Proteobacteria bacterium]|nr:hypothetical protein [Pseudomonadota bacterium]
MKLCCLINTSSGNKNGAKILKELSKINPQCIEKILTLTSSNFSDSLKLAEAHKKIIVFGGDGSVSSVLKHFQNKENKIGIYPLGTANDLARELGIYKLSKNLSVLELLQRYHQSESDLNLQLWNLEIADKIILFTNYLSFGFEAAVVNQFAKWRKEGKLLTRFGRISNKLAYALGIIKHFPHRLPKELCVELETQKIPLPDNLKGLIFSNIKSTAGICKTNTQGNPSDNMIEMICTGPIRSYFNLITTSFATSKSKDTCPSGTNWSISCKEEPIEIQIDGEHLGSFRINKALIYPAGTSRVLLPKDFSY